MSEVQVNKIQPEGESVLLLTQHVDALYDEIRQRAFLRFEARGGLHGFDRQDWLEAEQSLIFAPPAKLIEGESDFEIRVAVPGFEARQLRVNALPNAIIVDGDSEILEETGDQRVVFSEFVSRKLLRRITLPQEVKTYTAKAALKDGVLHILVKKAAPAAITPPKSVSAGA